MQSKARSEMFQRKLEKKEDRDKETMKTPTKSSLKSAKKVLAGPAKMAVMQARARARKKPGL